MQNETSAKISESVSAHESLEKEANIINAGAQSVMIFLRHRSGLFNVMTTLLPTAGKRFKTHAIVATLTLAIGTISYAENNHLGLTKDTIKPDTEMAMIVSDYFDANWRLFTGSGASHPSADDDMKSIAAKYFDANWSVTTKTLSTPAKSNTEVSTDYFDEADYSRGVRSIAAPR